MSSDCSLAPNGCVTLERNFQYRASVYPLSESSRDIGICD